MDQCLDILLGTQGRKSCLPLVEFIVIGDQRLQIKDASVQQVNGVLPGFLPVPTPTASNVKLPQADFIEIDGDFASPQADEYDDALAARAFVRLAGAVYRVLDALLAG